MSTKELVFLKECLRVEVIGGKDKTFSWLRVFRHAWRQPHRRYLFWWRIASYLHSTEHKVKKKIAYKINRKLIQKYNTEIVLGAQIGIGMKIAHYCGIVITGYSKIGANLSIRHNTTIGIKNSNLPANEYSIVIGDNVSIGANSCIISDQISIGDNIKIGAMSFVNKDIASNSIFYTEKTSYTQPLNKCA